MTRIDDVSTNDMNIKHLDTTKDIVITPRNEFGGQVMLNTDHTWTAKVSDGNNYIGDYPVTIEPNGIVVNSADFTQLPAGNYHLEIWEEWTDSNGSKQRSIYPSPQRTIDFTIYQNITDLAEKEIKAIGFQDVVDQAVMNIGMNYVFKVNTIEPDQTATVVQAAADGKNYVTFNIPRGPAPEMGAYVKTSRVLPAEAHDFNYLAMHMKTYQGSWWVGDDKVANAPIGNWSWAVIEVIPANVELTGVIRTTRFSTGDNYSANVDNGVIKHWTLIADGANVVHKTSNETISGNKTFVGNTTLATTTILEGSYGLRVTSSGIQKTTDGKTWVSADI